MGGGEGGTPRLKKSTMVCFNSESVVAELLSNKYLANLTYCGHTSRLASSRLKSKQKCGELEPNLWNQRDNGNCLMVLLRAKVLKYSLRCVGGCNTLGKGCGIVEEKPFAQL